MTANPFEFPEPHCKRAIIMNGASVQSRQEMIDHLFRLMDDFDGAGNMWANKDNYTFLQAMAAWLNDCEDRESASWQLFADALSAAAVHSPSD